VTVDFVLDGVSWILIGLGGALVVIGAIGLNRMPCVYSRMHATSLSDTFGAGLMIAGMMVQGGLSLVTLKLLFLLLFLWFTGPVVTHAVARAALLARVKPFLAKDSPVTFESTKGEASSSP
jgi:multicomponent Na+:H+ antiporter subunit G